MRKTFKFFGKTMSKWNNASTKTSFPNSSKRVEFSGTEIHFSPDSQRISIKLGNENSTPPYVINSSHSNIKSNDQLSQPQQPKRGILKNRMTKPDKYYLGLNDTKKLYNDEPNSKIKFDLPNELETSNKFANNNKNDNYSVTGKTNLTSYKLIIDMFNSGKNNEIHPSSSTSMESNKKLDIIEMSHKTIDKIRPIAKPRKIFPSINTPNSNYMSSISNGNQHGYQGNYKTESKTKFFETTFDLARDEKVLNDLINAADELIKNST